MIGGYKVMTATNGEEGLKLWKEQLPDIIVTDIEMPVMSGFDMVAKIRETDRDIPILFASGHISPKDVIAGYRLGANNYIKKPFNPEEMDAHLKASLKMSKGWKMRNESHLLSIGKYMFDPQRSLLIKENGEKYFTTAMEAHILKILAKNKGEIVKREIIESECWGKEKAGDYFTSRSLDVFITKLRVFFKDDIEIEIKTIKGVGLMLIDTSTSHI
jgi:DNA-binding response OmpR family regulator